MDKKHTIAIVDDDFIFREMLKENIAQNFECEILTFQTGEECVANLYLKPDLIILDYFLNSQNPEAENGLEILKKIRATNSKSKIIILSGQSDANVLYDFVRLNVSNYVVKDKLVFENAKMAIECILPS